MGWMLQWYQLYPVCEEGLMWDGCYNGISCIQFVTDGSCGMDVTMVSTIQFVRDGSCGMDVTMVPTVSSL